VKYLKKVLILLFAAGCPLFLGGCYTRLMTYQGEVTEAGSKGGGCADCREEVPYTGGRQVCVWERDLFGYPELRCYYTSYASSWLYFHNTPWWYRSNYGWRDTRGCPPYYYYDRFSGTCRYYGGSSYPGPNPGTGGGGGGAVAGSGRPRPQMRGITSGAAATTEPPPPVTEGSGLPPMFSGGANKTLSPAGAPSTPSSTPPSPPPSGSSGSDAGMSKPYGGGESQHSNPPAEQKPADKKPVDKNERPRPSMRGM
jgi:hypothetical protein